MGSIGKSIKKIVSPIANIASFIPGPHQGIAQAVSGIGSLLEQKDAAKRQDRLAEEALSGVRGGSEFQTQMAGRQADLLGTLDPTLAALREGNLSLINPVVQDALSAYESAKTYDPGVETEQLTRLYDAGLRDSLQSDLGNTRLPYSMRGFTGDSTDKTAATGNLLYNRARGRADFVTNMRLGERERKDAVTGAAASRLGQAFSLTNPVGPTLGVAGGYGGAAGTAGGATGANLNLAGVRLGQVGQYDPSSAIQQISSGISKIKLPTKKKPQASTTPTVTPKPWTLPVSY